MSSYFFRILLLGLVCSPPVFGQVKSQTPPRDQADGVVRVKTELVQTDVTVVDKRGRFVDGLTADDFELQVDSKPQPLSFFEKVIAGSDDEAKKIAAARKGDTAAKAEKTSASGT